VGLSKTQLASGWNYLNEHGEHKFVAQSKGRLPVSVVSSMIGIWATNGTFEQFWKHYTSVLKFEIKTKRHFSTMKKRFPKANTATRRNATHEFYPLSKYLDKKTKPYGVRVIATPKGIRYQTLSGSVIYDLDKVPASTMAQFNEFATKDANEIIERHKKQNPKSARRNAREVIVSVRGLSNGNYGLYHNTEYVDYFDTLAAAKKAAKLDVQRYRLEGIEAKAVFRPKQGKPKAINPRKRNTAKRSNPRNPEIFNEDKLDELSGIFQGHINGKQIVTEGSDFTPPLTSRLGKLSYIVFKNGREIYEAKFSGDAWLSADARKNIYAEGKNARLNGVKLPRKGELTHIGEVQQINYITNKSHIEQGKTVEYYHELGEVDSVKPNAFLDHDGYILFIGGNYDIGVHGIEN
jgi:hypothetical protein